MNENIIKKAKFLKTKLSEGKIIDFGSEDVNWEESLHSNLEEELGRKIIRIDKFGSPDIKIDLDEPFADIILEKFGKLDYLILSEVIEHLKSPYNFLVEIQKLMHNKSILIITTPNAFSLSEMQSIFSNSNHNKEYTKDMYSWNKHSMCNLFDEVNLKLVEFEYISFYWNKNYFFKFLVWLIPIFKPNLFFILEKRDIKLND